MKLLPCTGRILLWRWEGKGSGCSHALPTSAMCAVCLGMPSACSAAGAALLPITHGELFLRDQPYSFTGRGVIRNLKVNAYSLLTLQVSARGSEEAQQ